MIRPLILACLACLAAAADLAVEQAWSRATLADARTGAVFATIRNHGAAADTLSAVEGTAAATIEVHEHLAAADGSMRMQAVQGGLAIPAGGEVVLKPRSYHVMLIGLKQGLVQGGSFELVFVFAKAGRITVPVRINGAAAMGWDESR